MTLGSANTRVRDYADVYPLTGSWNIDHAVVVFADRLAEEAPATTRWDASTRQWIH